MGAISVSQVLKIGRVHRKRARKQMEILEVKGLICKDR